jgi:hypothetical protein
VVSFDPYLNWLGIAPHEQPPNYYRLLGVVLFESNLDVIQQAASRQSLRVGAYHAGPQGEMCQQLLNEIAVAEFCLLDPRQKAVYDSQLNESLSHRGERAVAAPPPPASMPGGRQLASTPRQLSPQAAPFDQPQQFRPGHHVPMVGGMPSTHPSPAAQRPMNLPGPPPPMHVQMPGQPMQPAPHAVMQMPPPMTASPGYIPPRAQTSPPAAIPVAAPFPTAVAKPVASAVPPAAPQRPIDELETLTSQTSGRRRVLRRRKKADYTKEIVVASVLAVGVIGLGAIYVGLNSRADETPKKTHNSTHKPVEQKKLKDKERDKSSTPAAGLAVDPPKFRSGAVAPKKPAARQETEVDPPLGPPINPGPPPHAMDAPAPSQPAGPTQPAAAPPPAQGHDTPQDLGGPNDPVMELDK